MRLTNYTDYCLRTLMFLAAQPDGRATIAQIADSYGISESHLVKVVHALGKADFLANVRGRGGGLRLARPAAEIRIGDVVRCAEGAPVPASCFDAAAAPCSIYQACRLRGVLTEAVDAFHEVLDRYTLADLVGTDQGLVKLRRLLGIVAIVRAPVAASGR
jgi:Rrf2 family transcriptional regulator, nitric oxide-sensitive transcriptional repressor